MYRKFIELINGLYPKIRSDHKIYLLLFALLILAYLPMLSFSMGLKNDALTLSYPLFHFFSEQLRHGSIPWWHPNIHMGFPLHAEPGFPFFSPITWSWALAGSSLYVFTLVLWTYIVIAAIGMIKLTRWLKFPPLVQVLVSLSYLVSGYYVSHLQHPHYLFETAFVPFCLLYTLRNLYDPGWRNAIFLAISLFFLINAGYPSFVLFTGYFLFMLTALIFFSDRSVRSLSKFNRFLGWTMVAGLLTLVLSLPYIVSIAEIYPQFNRIVDGRNNGAGGGATLYALLSLVFPLSTVTKAVSWDTDISWNNIYPGLFVLVFSVAGIAAVKHKLKFPLLLAGLLMFILSLSGHLKNVFNPFIPFFNLVSSNGGLRIYFILSLCLAAGWGANAFLRSEDRNITRNCCYFLTAVFTLTIICCLVFGVDYDTTTTLRNNIRDISFSNSLFVQSAAGLIFLISAWLIWKNKKALLLLGMAEMIFAFWINLPFTGLGLYPTASAQMHIDKVILSYRQLSTDAITEEISKSDSVDRMIREPLFFSSAVGMIPLSSYPSGYRNYFSFIRNGGARLILPKKTVFAMSDEDSSARGSVTVDQALVRPGKVYCTINSPFSDTIAVLQNHSANWSYKVNHLAVQTTPVFGTFTGIPISKGHSEIEGRYRPGAVIVCLAISTFAWGVVLMLLFVRKRKKP